MNKISKIKYLLIEKVFLDKYSRFKAKISLPRIKQIRYKSIVPVFTPQGTGRTQKKKIYFFSWISFLPYGIRKIKERFTAKKELPGFRTYCSLQERYDEIVPDVDVSCLVYKEDEDIRPSEHNLSEKLGISDDKISHLLRSSKSANATFEIPFFFIEERYYQICLLDIKILS
ncbi:hypothetical protein [Bacteroidetes bacterium endosymbiont of Geopemphigus sp.]|uniref:hypothetical protein n=1 Tax=Bacteroidetes bacterium endosymbiont of Geopemphigus sp. TaxID=2047937 RepID=UPI000CD1A55F|nr:hypothetical protein [Bacteroidetes bacterium endosymbiont of Geopemphigus sp.]